MSNTGIYLKKEQKEKLKRISKESGLSESQVIDTMIRELDENWLIEASKKYLFNY